MAKRRQIHKRRFKSLKLKTCGDIKGGFERFASVRAAVGSTSRSAWIWSGWSMRQDPSA
jgi:hypothetical protein